MSDYRCCVGTFAAANAIGNQVVSGVADSLGTFTPKFILLWSTEQAAPGFLDVGHFSIFINQLSQFSAGAASYKPDSGVSGYRAFIEELAFAAAGTSLTVVTAAATLQNTGLGTFTVNWTVVNGVYDIHYLAVGGTDFACLLNYLINPATAINKTVTGLGIGTVNGIFTLPIFARGNLQTFIGGVAVDDQPAVGWTDGVSQGASCGGSFDLQLTKYQRTDRCYLQHSRIAVNVINAEAEIVSVGADTFTMHWIQTFLGNFGTAGQYYAAFSGAKPIVCGSLVQGDASILLSGRPGAVLFMSANALPSSTAGTPLEFSFGAVGDTGNQVATWLGARAVGGANQSARGYGTTSAILLATVAASGSASVVKGQASAVITDTGVTLTWSVNDGVPREILYMAFGVEAITPPPPTGCVPSTNVSVSSGILAVPGAPVALPVGPGGSTPGSVGS